MKIMLVEDNPRVRDLIKEIIRGEVECVDTFFECEDGMTAIEQYEKVHPDWVLMDIEMDRMDGIAASKQILQRFPGAKIMIVTQYDDPGYRKAAREMGIFAYVLKENLIDIPVLLKRTLI